MKKIMTMIGVLLSAVMMASCGQPQQSDKEFSIAMPESSVQESSEAESSMEPSSQERREQESSQKASVSEEASHRDVSSDSRTREVISQLVDVEKLGDKTKAVLDETADNDSIYMDVRGDIVLFGGLTSQFDIQIAKSSDGLMESISLGEETLKFISNDDGVYQIDDTAQIARHTEQTDSLQEVSAETSVDAVVNQILAYLSHSFGLESLQYTRSGSEEYQGSLYSFEEYKADPYTVKVYFDGDTPKYLTSTDKNKQTSVLTVNALTSSPDQNLFTVPKNYTIVESESE